MSPARVSRFDVATIGRPVRTPQGFLRVPAALTRAGVLTYKRADGTTVRELRPAEEVFRPDSLASLGYAPVTDLHPTEMVSPKNVKKLSVGHVSAVVHKDGHLVAGTITIEDDAAITAVESGARREVSCGYQCRIDATPGTHEGEPYDCVQRDIVYNHAALGPRNWGRAGRDVALRVDGTDGGTADEDVFRLDSGDALGVTTFEAPPDRRSDNDDDDGGDMDLTTLRIDGLDVQVPKQWAQVLEKGITTRDDSIAALTKQRDQLQAKCDATAKDLTDAQAKLTVATDPKRLDAAVNERATLLEQARRVLPADHKFEGETPRKIHEAVLKRLDDKLDLTGRSDEYVSARFDHAMGGLGADTSHRNDALDESRRATTHHVSHERRNDAAPPPPPIPDWQKPLSVSKDNNSRQ